MLVVSFIGIMIITFPKKQELKKLKFEKGFIFIIISVIIGAIGSLFYKYSANLVDNYTTFLIGRLSVDYIVYGLAILFIIPLFNGFNSKKNWSHFLKKKNSKLFLALVILESLVGSYLIFVLPISTLAVIGTISIPLSFILGRIRYKEKQNVRAYIGSLIVFISIIIFVLS